MLHVSPFNHCPRCAESVAGAGTREFRCPHCGFRYFHNVAAATGAFIVHGDELLVARRANDPGRGLLDVPGGFADPGESLEASLARELAEELGWTTLPAVPSYLCSLPNLYPFADVTYATMDAFFLLVCAERPQAVAEDDIASLAWVPRGALRVEDFAFESTRKALTRLLAGAWPGDRATVPEIR